MIAKPFKGHYEDWGIVRFRGTYVLVAPQIDGPDGNRAGVQRFLLSSPIQAMNLVSGYVETENSLYTVGLQDQRAAEEALREQQDPDFEITGSSTAYVVSPLNNDARDWLLSYYGGTEDRTWNDGKLYVEHRYIAVVEDHMRIDGFFSVKV